MSEPYSVWSIWKEGNEIGPIYVPKLGVSVPPFLLLSNSLY